MDREIYEDKYYEESTQWQSGAFKRISWGAIFAGVVVAFAIQTLLNLFGIGIGLSTIDILTDEQPFSGLGLGAGIWLTISSILALLAGGWTAGRMAGFPGRKVAALHGVITWSLVCFVTVSMIAFGTGSLVGGALNVVNNGVQAAGQGIVATNLDLGENETTSFDAVKAEVYAILRQTGQEELQPEYLETRFDSMVATARDAASDALITPADARQDIEQAFDRLITDGQAIVDEVDREAAVNVLLARTDMTEAEATRTVAQYEQVIEDAKARLDAEMSDLKGNVAQATDNLVEALSKAALWSFFAMVIGVISAAAGGYLGAPQSVPVLENKEKFEYELVG